MLSAPLLQEGQERVSVAQPEVFEGLQGEVSAGFDGVAEAGDHFVFADVHGRDRFRDRGVRAPLRYALAKLYQRSVELGVGLLLLLQDGIPPLVSEDDLALCDERSESHED